MREAVAAARAADPFGHPIHLALAMAYAFVLPLDMVPPAKDFILVGLLIFTLLRLPKIFRCYGPIWRDPLTWWIIAWPIWLTISLSWTPLIEFGAEEIRAWRMVLIPSLLWPVMIHYRIIIGAFLAGCLTIVLYQLGQLVSIYGLGLDIHGRADAGMHPILAGSLLSAATVWFLSGIYHWNGKRSAAAAAGVLITIIGLVLTGSRGPWIALSISGTLLTLGVILLWPPSRKCIGIFSGLGALALVGIIMLDVFALSGRFTDPVLHRVDAALSEYQDAPGENASMTSSEWYRSSVGYRLLAWEAARSVFEQHPIIGSGAGGISAYLDEAWWLNEPEKEVAGVKIQIQHLNPHSMYLQVLASTGIIGLALILVPMILSFIRLVRRIGEPVYCGAGFVLVSWAVGSIFDSYQMVGTQVGLLMLVYAASLAARPKYMTKEVDS
ncbi:MAG: O-antigen ligase family protein [Phycisphaerales bacterium]|nr:O-antigen ligase family protein [Phycisphaerales bacterium]